MKGNKPMTPEKLHYNTISAVVFDLDSTLTTNELMFHPDGTYSCLNQDIPLWKNIGKQEIVAMIKATMHGQALFVGDSMGDLKAGAVAGNFICFAGVARRENVIARAGVTVYNLMNILEHIDHSQ